MSRLEGQRAKLLCVWQILMEKTDEETGITLSALIEQLRQRGIPAERKGLYHDFACLTELGYPVEKLATRPVTYHLASRPFELAELKLLVDAVQSSRFITAERSRALIEKLEQFAGPRAGELSRQVYVEGRVKTENPAALYHVDALHAGIAGRYTVSFGYFEYGVDKRPVLRHGGLRYLVLPKALIWREENYYLVAFDERAGSVKSFRVDKMQDIRQEQGVRPSAAALAAHVDPSAYSQRSFSMFGGEEERVTLEVRASLAGVMLDRFGTEEHFFPTDFGFRFSTRVMLSPTFYAWVMGFGGDVRILAPARAVTEIRARLACASAAYAADPAPTGQEPQT